MMGEWTQSKRNEQQEAWLFRSVKWLAARALSPALALAVPMLFAGSAAAQTEGAQADIPDAVEKGAPVPGTIVDDEAGESDGLADDADSADGGGVAVDAAGASEAPPLPAIGPETVTASDAPWDNGRNVILTWTPVDGETELFPFYSIERWDPADEMWKVHTPRVESGAAKRTDHGKAEVQNLVHDVEVRLRLVPVNAALEPVGAPIEANLVTPDREWFFGDRLWLGIITLVFCGAVVFWIGHARSGRPVRVRKIAGLEAVDEAVGRATEMGRPCLYVPGIQDINDIQTIAGITILSRVARTAAEYDAKVEVPTSKSLVMTTAREAVQAAYLSAGRPDAYNQDLIYYVTDEQFGYVAYLQGMMVREKPAACFYMGAFFAESLILAETGNSIGAIQVAGTAQPAQLPFFVAACDYTLIGEEFFAASAYLSGSPEELGSLKGQDVGKIIVAVLLIIGVILATLGVLVAGPDDIFDTAVQYLRDTILT